MNRIMLFCCIISVATAYPVAVEDVVSVITTVKQIMQVGCLYVFFKDHSVKYLFSMEKLLQQSVKAGCSFLPIKYLTDPSKKFNCWSKLPLFVILPFYGIQDDIKKISDARGGLSDASWLLFSQASPHDVLTDAFVPIHSRVLVARFEGVQVLLQEVYHAALGCPLTVLDYGRLDKSGWEQTQHRPSMYIRRANWSCITFRATTIQEMTPMVMDTGAYESVQMRVWVVLQEKLNFSTNYHLPPDGKFGTRESNGLWNGMIGMLVDGRVDVGIEGFSMEVDRLDVVDFTSVIEKSRYSVYIRKQETAVVHWHIILQPFSPGLWITVAFTVGAISFIFWLQCRLTNRSTSDVVITICGIFCDQASSINNQCHWMRVLLIWTYATAIFINKSYSAILISYLTIQDEKLPFNNFQELLDIGYYRLGVISGTAPLGIFKHSSYELLRKIYTSLILPVEDSERKHSLTYLERVCREDHFAYIDAETDLNSFRRLWPCPVMPVRGVHFPATFSITLRKNSPYTQLINYYIQRQREAGILRKFEQIKNPPVPEDPVNAAIRGIPLSSVAPVLALLLLAVVTSIIFLLIERRRVSVTKRVPRITRKPKLVIASRRYVTVPPHKELTLYQLY